MLFDDNQQELSHIKNKKQIEIPIKEYINTYRYAINQVFLLFIVVYSRRNVCFYCWNVILDFKNTIWLKMQHVQTNIGLNLSKLGQLQIQSMYRYSWIKKLHHKADTRDLLSIYFLMPHYPLLNVKETCWGTIYSNSNSNTNHNITNCLRIIEEFQYCSQIIKLTTVAYGKSCFVSTCPKLRQTLSSSIVHMQVSFQINHQLHFIN